MLNEKVIEVNCPVYEKTISDDLCYDSSQCLLGFFKIDSTKELTDIDDIEKARKICSECPHSKWDD